MQSDDRLLAFLVGIGLVAACSGDAEPSGPSADAAQDATALSEAGDASRFDVSSEAPRDIVIDSQRDATIDVVTDVPLDIAIDVVDAETGGLRDTVTDGAADATADLPDDLDAGVTDVPTTDTGTPDISVADTSTPDTGAPDTGADDASIADTGAADGYTPDAPSDAVEAGIDAATAPPNIIFVTSTLYTGNMGGLAGADDKCHQRAQAAGLSGTFVALLSTSTVNAKSRLGTARGWVRTDGKPFADQQQDLFGLSAHIYYPPRVDEFGNTVPVNTVVKSGTRYDGTVAPQGAHCVDWTSNGDGGSTDMMMGFASHGASGYIDNGWTGCVYATRLYCIEISRTSRVDPPSPPQPHRTAFVSNGIFLPPNGIAAADTLCNTEAAGAGLPGTYAAFLATKQASAMSRFDLGGSPWVRVDGVVIAATASDFAAGNFFAPLNVMANGTYLSNWGVWTGSTGPSAVGTSTCNDWSPSPGDAGAEKGITATASSSSATWSNEQTCDWTFGRVFCLQQ